MTTPITTDIPHTLGKDIAKARIDSGIGKLAGYIPGGSVTDHRWEGDTMLFTVEAMGQRIATRLEVLDDKIRAHFELPGFLAIFGNKIRAMIEREGPKLLK